MPHKTGTERATGNGRKGPSAKYFRLHPKHESAVKQWVELHGADETIVYKVGAFLFMSLPLGQRVEATRRYLEWVRADFPTEGLDWPQAEEQTESDYRHRIGHM